MKCTIITSGGVRIKLKGEREELIKLIDELGKINLGPRRSASMPITSSQLSLQKLLDNIEESKQNKTNS